MNKSERNKGIVTAAMTLFAGKKLVTERPEGMMYEDYKIIRSIQNKVLSKMFVQPPNKKINLR